MGGWVGGWVFSLYLELELAAVVGVGGLSRHCFLPRGDRKGHFVVTQIPVVGGWVGGWVGWIEEDEAV